MQKPPQQQQEINYLQYDTVQYRDSNNRNSQTDLNHQQQKQPQQQIIESRQQYFYIKLTLSAILVVLSTIQVQSQMQYFGPFVRTVQCFFNYHLMQHPSQDIYQGIDVIFYRTQEFTLRENIFGFFNKYIETMDTFHNNSFFYQTNSTKSTFQFNNLNSVHYQNVKFRQFQKEYSKQRKQNKQDKKAEIIEVLVVYESNRQLNLSNNVGKYQAYENQLMKKYNMKIYGANRQEKKQIKDQSKNQFNQIDSQQNKQNLKQKSYIFPSLKTSQQKQWIVSLPLTQLRDFFQSTVFTQQFYQSKIKRIQLITNLYIKFKQGTNCVVKVKTQAIFYSLMMISTKVDTTVLDEKEDYVLSGQKDRIQKTQYSETEGQNSQQNLKIRKMSQFHHLDGLNFQQSGILIFIINGLLFCIQLMVIIRTNYKLQQKLQQQAQFEKKIFQLQQYHKRKNSPIVNPINKGKLINTSKQQSQNNQSFVSSQQQSFQGHIHNKIKDENHFQSFLGFHVDTQKISYGQRLKMIGVYNIIELVISFLVLITVNNNGMVCFLCWTKITLYLSQTGNRMMFGFLFKNALPAFFRVIVNLSIWLSGFVFFSMVVFQFTKKFQSVELSYYQYIFNYFQYGIFQNFIQIQKKGSFFSFLYFIQLLFLVLLANNILMSILAQQVLKNSNMHDLTDFIQSIEVQCPVCGCPPQIKKKIKVKLKKQNLRQNLFISKYFQEKKQIAKKSRYQIKILSPQFSPMFHKSQIRKKNYKLRKRSNNLISIVGQQSVVGSPPPSPPYSPLNRSPNFPPSPLYPPSIGYPQSPMRNPLSPTTQRKKVLIQIGGQVQAKNITKIQQYTKIIRNKTQIINKLVLDISFGKQSQNLSIKRANREFYNQILKRKVEDIKKIIEKIG